MNKVINVKSAIKLAQKIHNENKTIVITGGCFDILHVGHIKLLEASKKRGDYLMVFLENDKSVKTIKGESRPINNLKDRAYVLASISFVDFVVTLPYIKTNKSYDLLVKKINPNVITSTKNSPQAVHIKRQAKETGAEAVFAINNIKNKSTTKLARIISNNFK